MSGVAALPASLAGAAINAASTAAWFAPVLVAAMAYFHYELMDPESQPIDVPTSSLLPEYDFIIVGGGSAGILVFKLDNDAWLVLIYPSCNNYG